MVIPWFIAGRGLFQRWRKELRPAPGLPQVQQKPDSGGRHLLTFGRYLFFVNGLAEYKRKFPKKKK